MNYPALRPCHSSDLITHYEEVYILFLRNLMITYVVFLIKIKVLDCSWSSYYFIITQGSRVLRKGCGHFLENYLAQRPCLGSNIFAYHKDLLFVFDIEIICLVYIKINDDWLYGLHNFVITYNILKTMIRYTSIKYCISGYNITIVILSFILVVNLLNQWYVLWCGYWLQRSRLNSLLMASISHMDNGQVTLLFSIVHRNML